MALPTILFFARGYQADFFPVLTDARYHAVFATMTRAEAARVRRRGQSVAACFEADFEGIEPAEVPADYLITSFMSDRFLGRFGRNQRLAILGKEIAFWRALLDRLQPRAVVNELVAIEISEVLLIECRRRNIPYLAGMNNVVDDYFYWLPDPMTISGTRLPNATSAGPQARALAADYVRKLMEKDYAPFYVKNLAGRRALKPLAAGAAKGALWGWRGLRDRSGPFRYEMYGEEYGKRLAVYGKSLINRYDRLEDLPADAEVVFFPLHQEPEATLNYMSEFYANQVATIENILKCLAPGQVLVIKEHPVDKGSLLRRKFWEIRKRYSGLYDLPAEVHGRQVLPRAGRVVTLTSTVGWEAAVLGKPVYVLGEIFYDNLPGLNRVAGWPELKTLLRQPADRSERLTVEAAEAFVARTVEMSYPGNPFPHADLYSPANIAHVVAAIVDGAGIEAEAAPVSSPAAMSAA